MLQTKYIFVVGGVLSGVGKGITTASVGRILINRGLRVSAIKIDPYINVDAGTMNPVEHGEVFVTKDGDETDQDIGNYERFLDNSISSLNYMTTGRVYMSVIEKERQMKYGGRCVQVVPDIPNEVISRIKNAAQTTKARVMIIEIGGTVGEYENLLFLEAARMMKLAEPSNVMFILVSYFPVPGHLGEMKTKPTQHAVRAMNNSGLHPDFIVARGKYELDKPRREKLSRFCALQSQADVIAAPDVESIYDVPAIFAKQKFAELIAKKLKLRLRDKKNLQWKNFVSKMRTANKQLKFAVVGKYFGTGDYTLADSYISVIEAIKHAAWRQGAKPELTWVDSEDFESKKEKLKELSKYDGVIVPGGFGTRGIEGIIAAIKYVREHKIPYLGLCYGMQLASVEFARHVLKLNNAHTIEVHAHTKHPIIIVNPIQNKNIKENRYGGTMRLGSYECNLKEGSKVQKLYKAKQVSERHRHRYEFNNQYLKQMEEAGLDIVGVNPQSKLVEIIELKKHPFFVGTQFHPELQSRPLLPHPLFMGLIKAALTKKK